MNTDYEEMKRKTIAQQRAKLETYDVLVEEGLPIPEDLRYEIEASGVRPRLMEEDKDPGPEPSEEVRPWCTCFVKTPQPEYHDCCCPARRGY